MLERLKRPTASSVVLTSVVMTSSAYVDAQTLNIQFGLQFSESLLPWWEKVRMGEELMLPANLWANGNHYSKEPFHGWIFGAGPVFLLPTATDNVLGTGKWAAGPTAVGLRQEDPWTYRLLANHLWSFAGEGGRPDMNQTFLQPFLAYNTKTAFGVTLQTESTYNWEAHQWTVPLGLFASQVLKVGEQPLSMNFGPRVYVDGPSGGPEWGLRFTITLLFPN
jgi:hypothetical protein